MQGIKQDDFYYSGNLKLLEKNPISIFCSKEIPLSIYYPSNELFLKILSFPIVLVSGWQSAMEKRMLKNYNGSSRAEIIYSLSKGIKNFTLPSYLQKPYNEGHLLVLSPYLEEKGISFKRVQGRDKLILRLIDRYLFFYINKVNYYQEFLLPILKKLSIPSYCSDSFIHISFLNGGLFEYKLEFR